jgi:hypothetical protein
MSDYTTVGGDSLPSIAELYGHPGEWLALAEANEGHIWGDFNNLQPGLEITVPADWIGAEPKADAAPAEDFSSMTASQLANLAYAATTLAELDAIDAAAAGRVTVTNAVATRRGELLDQGATA